MIFRRIIPLLFVSLSSAYSAAVDLLPEKDNTMFEPITVSLDDPNFNPSNGKGDYIFVGRISDEMQGKSRRGLIKFDIAGSVPSGATITSAKLRLYLSNTIREPSVKTVDISLHRLPKDWGESDSSSDGFGGGGGGATASPGDATWYHNFFNTDLWDSPGGDFEANPSATQSIGDKFRFYTWESEGLAIDVQLWLENPNLNFGWILVGDEMEIETAKRFDSLESFNFSSDNQSTRPVLQIEYMEGPTSDGSDSRLVNISTRGYAATGIDSLVAGIVISGNQPKPVLIRGIGPSLAAFGTQDFLTQPRIELLSGQDLVDSNEDWGQGSQVSDIQAANTATGAFAIETDSGDAALIATLDPGLYTVRLSSGSGDPGLGLVEVYEIE